MLSGTGGSETFTAGHARELLRRGIDAQVVVLNSGVRASRKDFPDIPFISLDDERQISNLAGKVVFINQAYNVPTKQKAAIILHCSIPSDVERNERMADVKGKIIIATSVYNVQRWALYLGVHSSSINVAKLLGFEWADVVFGGVANVYKKQYPHIGDNGSRIINQEWPTIKFDDPAPELLKATSGSH